MDGMQGLDVDAVKAFVTVAELQSFTRAAETLKRLEDRIGERSIERTPRLVRLSARGAA
jgi:DNA-binding transcriptional LysR family regulator